MKNLLIYFIVFICFFLVGSIAFAHTYPNAFGFTNRAQFLLDEGSMWNVNSTFQPLLLPSVVPSRMYDHSIYRSLKTYSMMQSQLREDTKEGFGAIVVPGFGIARQVGSAKRYEKVALQPSLWVEAYYHQHFYGKLFVRVSNEANSLVGFSGASRTIKRAGFNASEVDVSALGFRNSWVNLEYGRTREIWGPFPNENVFLSTQSAPYERIALELRYKRFRYRWFYGYLESMWDTTVTANVHRYLVGRCLEYQNGKNLVVSFGEFSTLAGPNRSVDMSFLNPVGAHLEIEQNHRTNDTKGNHANNLLYASFDWLAFPSLRISAAIGMDEFQIDFADRNRKEADQLLYNAKIAWTPMKESFTTTFLGNLYYADTYSLQHSYAYTNFVTRNQLMGHPLANDAEEYRAGMRVSYNRLPATLTMEYGYRAWGDSSLSLDPYHPYHSTYRTKHPSGQVRTNRFLAFTLDTEFIERLTCQVSGQFDIGHSGLQSEREAWTISLSYYHPFSYFTKDEKN